MQLVFGKIIKIIEKDCQDKFDNILMTLIFRLSNARETVDIVTGVNRPPSTARP
ncbi:hypothetical protein SCAZ3_00505 [Streptococcus canis FSL Z3-227]|uniref:Uncharacterized protein n=1 Tax=Streptococcus canis FSL Z3-227 TaxID=482234 RepID=A0AAV3FPG9_STRCB|nr:hypothetical protein SCAZ3_00505 [Streptococcus canis FSL Z3-227]